MKLDLEGFCKFADVVDINFANEKRSLLSNEAATPYRSKDNITWSPRFCTDIPFQLISKRPFYKSEM